MVQGRRWQPLTLEDPFQLLLPNNRTDRWMMDVIGRALINTFGICNNRVTVNLYPNLWLVSHMQLFSHCFGNCDRQTEGQTDNSPFLWGENWGLGVVQELREQWIFGLLLRIWSLQNHNTSLVCTAGTKSDLFPVGIDFSNHSDSPYK